MGLLIGARRQRETSVILCSSSPFHGIRCYSHRCRPPVSITSALRLDLVHRPNALHVRIRGHVSNNRKNESVCVQNMSTYRLAIIHMRMDVLIARGPSMTLADNLDARAAGNLECVARDERRQRRRQANQFVSPPADTKTGAIKHTHKRTPPAASSGVAARPRGMPANGLGPFPPGPWGIPRATFLPSISIEAPASFAAVSLCIHPS